MKSSITSTKMKYYLDSNICIFHMRNPYGTLAAKINSVSREQIKLPAIVKAELLTGAMKSARREKNIEEVLQFCEPFEIVPFDDQSAMIYGEIRASLERKGQRIGFNDIIIAATVLSRNGVLITNNTQEFNRIEGLLCSDWTQESTL